jgi:DNA-binding NarL/FixJ family response regulator
LPCFEAEVEFLHRDGNVVLREVRIVAERDASGQVVAFHGVTREIPARKRAEAALVASADRLRSLFAMAMAQSPASTEFDGMPHMDGAEAFGELRRLNPDVRVVLASGYSQEDVGARFAGKGPDSVLQKPYALVKLRELLAGLMPEQSPGKGAISE